MSNEEVKRGMSFFDGNEPGMEETISRRPWHRPPVTRIEIKRTLFLEGSVEDGTPVASSN